MVLRDVRQLATTIDRRIGLDAQLPFAHAIERPFTIGGRMALCEDRLGPRIDEAHRDPTDPIAAIVRDPPLDPSPFFELEIDDDPGLLPRAADGLQQWRK